MTRQVTFFEAEKNRDNIFGAAGSTNSLRLLAKQKQPILYRTK